TIVRCRTVPVSCLAEVEAEEDSALFCTPSRILSSSDGRLDGALGCTFTIPDKPTSDSPSAPTSFIALNCAFMSPSEYGAPECSARIAANCGNCTFFAKAALLIALSELEEALAEAFSVALAGTCTIQSPARDICRWLAKKRRQRIREILGSPA